ncbi:MAG: pilin [Candidatus Berkelbacteria bacterium]
MAMAGILPGGDPSTWTANDVHFLISNVIVLMTNLAGIVATVFIIWGAFQYLTAFGSEEKAETGKKTLTWAIIGLVLIILSRVIVNELFIFTSGSSQPDFNQNIAATTTTTTSTNPNASITSPGINLNGNTTVGNSTVSGSLTNGKVSGSVVTNTKTATLNTTLNNGKIQVKVQPTNKTVKAVVNSSVGKAVISKVNSWLK